MATDSSGKEIKVVETQKDEKPKSDISAIILNKESLLAKLQNEGKLTDELKTTIEDLAKNLDSYNEDKITDQDLKDFTKALATNKKIEKTDLKSYLETILSGLNKQTNKAANINYDEIITYAYPEKIEEKSEEELKVIDKNSEEKSKEEKPQDQKENKDDLIKVTSDDKAESKTESKAEIKEKAAKAFENDLAKLKEEAKKEPEKKTGVFEGLKSLLGQSDLQKADKELKEALADKTKTLEDIQNLLTSFESKYKLSKADQAKLMDDNGDAIKALVEKTGYTGAHVFAVKELTQDQKANLEKKKFHIITRFDTSNANGPIQPNQYFYIHLDNKLKVKNPSELKPIYYQGRVIAKPKYIANEKEKKIRYKIQGTIPENIKVPLDIPVDYDVTSIKLDDDDTFTVTNKVSGLGLIDPPKDLVPQKIDKYGNFAGSIIEPGRNDVNQILENDGIYKIYIGGRGGQPRYKDGELEGFDWHVTVESTYQDLKSLGFTINFTTVKGSGLGKIQDLKINGQDPGNDVTTNEEIAGKLGIVDSKNYQPSQAGLRKFTYTFFVKKTNTQDKYVLDVSAIANNKLGASRLIAYDNYSKDKIAQATPTRVGINNRTTIMGEFQNENQSLWTVTDAVSTGDDKDLPSGNKKLEGLPLADRNLTDQSINSSNMAVYVMESDRNNKNYGKMVVKQGKTDLNNTIPEKGKNPSGTPRVGTIAVYQYGADLEKPSNNEKKIYSLGGVVISKNEDLYIDQNWAMPDGLYMPEQTIIAKGRDGREVGKVEVTKATDSSLRRRQIILRDAKVWTIDSDGKAKRYQPKLEQKFPDGVNYNWRRYVYAQNYNYFVKEDNEYFLHNRADMESYIKSASFTLKKVDENDKPKGGAKFRLFRGPIVETDEETGEASFDNIKPGSYSLIEVEAPAGYKVAKDVDFLVDDEGRISLSDDALKRDDVTVEGGKAPTTTIEHKDWPGYMNVMHYGDIDQNGNVTSYIFLKAIGNKAGGTTDKNTRVNISYSDIRNFDIEVYDVDPSDRNDIRKEMNLQNVYSDDLLRVLNRRNKFPINGEPTNNGSGYTIGFPKERFGGADNWGFLIKITGKAGTNPTLKYDWITDNSPNDASLRNNDIKLSRGSNENTVIKVKDKPFEKKPIEVIKVDANKKPLGGATFNLIDSKGKVISTVISSSEEGDNKGKASFGMYPEGTYTIEEKVGPEGYVESQIVFDVTVDKAGQVTYKARNKNGVGVPIRGEDYWIENNVVTDTSARAKIIRVKQSMTLKEGQAGGLGTRTGVWDAYGYESYTYHANIDLQETGAGKRFEIQFDPNLDFTQYVNEIPSIKENGKVIAKPYFDYQTNLLTYVFTPDSSGGEVKFDLNIMGIIPSKFYAKNSGHYKFGVEVGPNLPDTDVEGNKKISFDVEADYGSYHFPEYGAPGQAYYFRDVYKQGNDWYVKVIAYYNPTALAGGGRTLSFNWMSTRWDGNTPMINWSGVGVPPAFGLDEVKVYRVLPVRLPNRTLTAAMYMPLSMGVVPENDPNTYELVLSSQIDYTQSKSDSQNGIGLTYNPSLIKYSQYDKLNVSKPLQLRMPGISGRREGYVIEQNFKVTNLNNFTTMFRAFYMSNGGSFGSAFASKVNTNEASAEQNKREIPKFYSQRVMMANQRYTPGNFTITKLDESDHSKKLEDVEFGLTDSNQQTIYRSSNIEGKIPFTDLKPGTYTLKETKTPKDYINANKTWQVDVAMDGTVTITEFGLNVGDATYVGKNLQIEITNKPAGQKFRVYKKGETGKPLAGATFTIKKKGETNVFAIGVSDGNGLVKFKDPTDTNIEKQLTDGTYILEESDVPDGYKKLDTKWVLVVGGGKVEVYEYSKKTQPTPGATKNYSLLGDEGTKWVDIAKRPVGGRFNGLNDPRLSGYLDNYPVPHILGTRIVGINKTQKFVVQRYIINPEAANMKASMVQIYREPLKTNNMTWYQGNEPNESYKVFQLKEAVTGRVGDIKLNDYGFEELSIRATKVQKPGEIPERLQLELPATNKPILIDVKIPYISENGPVGTGIDYFVNYKTPDQEVYWKPDYYEYVSDIVEGDVVKPKDGSQSQDENILGPHIGEGSLDVSNVKNRHRFEFKKIREKTTDAVSGATFTLEKIVKEGEEAEEAKWKKSGPDGKVEFDDLLPGKYKLSEHGAAQGYDLANTDWTVTVKDDGKVYIKDNNASNTVTDNNPDHKWQRVKVNQGTKSNRSESHNPDFKNSPQQKLNTNIVEVNNTTHRMRQVYILNASAENLNNPNLQIHAEPENRDITNVNTKVLSINVVNNSSTPDNLVRVGDSVSFTTQEILVNGHNRLKVETSVTGPKTLAVTVESDMPQAGAIGTGMDFVNYNNIYWAAESYASINDFVLENLPDQKVDKNTGLVVGKEKEIKPQFGTSSTNQSNPVHLQAINKLMRRNSDFKSIRPEPVVLGGGMTHLEQRSALLRTRMARSIAPRSMTYSTRAARAPRAADVWEKVDQNRSINRTTSNRATDNQTKITEINKDQGKYRQIFLVNKSGSSVDSPRYKFHAEPVNASVIGKTYYGRQINFKVLSIRPVKSSSTIDNIQYDGNQTLKYNNDEVIADGQYHRYQFRLATNDKRPIVIEVEYDYPKSGEIGLGMDYYSSYRSNGIWAAEKYGSVADINCKHSVIINQPREATLIPSSTLAKKGTPINLTVNPNTGYEGYVLDSLTVTDANGGDVSVNGTSFVMPDTDVTVRASFRQNGGITYRYGYEDETVPMTYATKHDDTMDVGTQRVENGQDGIKRTYYKYEQRNGSDTGNREIDTSKGNNGVEIIKEMKPQITYIGTKQTPTPTPTYTVWTENTKLSASPNQNVAAGTPVKVTVTLGANEDLDRLYYNDGSRDVDIDKTTMTFPMPASNVTVKATYKAKTQPEYRLSLVPNSDDNGSVTFPAKAKVGDKVTLTINPNPGYILKDLEVLDGDGHKFADYDKATNSFIMPAGNVWLRPHFVSDGTTPNPPQGKFSVNLLPTTNGTVEADKTSANQGDTVKLNFSPADGYEVDKLTINNIEYKVTNNMFDFIMPDYNTFVKVTFKEKSYEIKTDQTEGGWVGVDKHFAKKGEKVTVTVQVHNGYELGQVTANGQPVRLKDGKYTFTMEAGPVNVSATFFKPDEKELYFVGIDRNDGRYHVNITEGVDGNNQAVAGQTVKFKTTPQIGYAITGAYVKTRDGVTIPVDFANNEGSFVMPSSDCTIYLRWDNNPPKEGVNTVFVDPGMVGGKVKLNTNDWNKPLAARKSDRVDFTISTWDGYTNLGYWVSTTNGGSVPVNHDSKGPYFIMPDEDVTVYASFTKQAQASYSVTVKPSDHGRVIARPTSANQGANVSLDVRADKGYKLGSIKVIGPNNQDVKVENNSFVMPAGNVEIQASFIGQGETTPGGEAEDQTLPDDEELGYLIYDPANNKQKNLSITNKPAGFELRVYKRDPLGTPLQGGEFTLTRVDKTYENPIGNITLTGISENDGKVVFRDEKGNAAKLDKGYYVLKETKPPLGRKQATSDWRIEVKDDKGQMYAIYYGPKKTSSEFLNDDSLAKFTGTTNNNDGIKTVSRIKNIDPVAKTFVQRTIIDLRNYHGEDLNVQITPKHKRDEEDFAPEEVEKNGEKKKIVIPPNTIEEGLKTAYRTSYQITSPDPNLNMDDVLQYYDLSKKGVTMVNTARWRPFNWGFDEDQLNLKAGGFYFIDIEGYYDEALLTGIASHTKGLGKNAKVKDPYKRDDITEEDLGKLQMNIQLYQGSRQFQQLMGYDQDGNPIWKAFKGASYLGGTLGAEAKRHKKGWINEPYEKDPKYINMLGKDAGRISPSLENATPYKEIKTEPNISSLYTSSAGDAKPETIPKTGLDLINEQESYNITFSKHGRDGEGEDWSNNSENVTNNRLEGAIFKLEREVLGGFEDVEGSYVSSAFNGFFGFRALKPGRYRLMEVQAPPGYRPIHDPILYMTISYEKEQTNQATGEITPGRGAITLEYNNSNGIIQYAGANTQGSGQLVDFVTSGTAKNMGKIINEKPGKGKVTLLKQDENGKVLNGAMFRLTRLGVKAKPSENTTFTQYSKLLKVETKAKVLAQHVQLQNKANIDVLTIDEMVNEGTQISGHTLANVVVTIKFGNTKTTVKSNNRGYFYYTLPPGTSLSTNTEVTASIEEEGVAIFNQLPIGNYELEEALPAPGHKLTGQRWQFTVGGKDLDPYAEGVPRTDNSKDKTSDISIKDSTLSIKRPRKDDDSKGNDKIWPNRGQMLEFFTTFKIKPDTVINPGDYFKVKLTDNIDLNGIFKNNKTEGLDIFSDGVGTIAKGEYNKQTNEITYTFTDYAKVYKLLEFNTTYIAFINPKEIKVPTNNVVVGPTMNNVAPKTKVNVGYEYGAYYSYAYGGYSTSMSSKITEFNPKTGEFTHIFYVNLDSGDTGGYREYYTGNWIEPKTKFEYLPGKTVTDLNIEAYKYDRSGQYNTTFLNQNLPPSYGIDLTGKDPDKQQFYGREVDDSNNGFLEFDRIYSKDAYIIKVTGKIVDRLDKTSYTPTAMLSNIASNNFLRLRVTREDAVYANVNDAQAKADLTVKAVNPKNVINFKKLGENKAVLPGAKFKLMRQTTKEDKTPDPWIIAKDADGKELKDVVSQADGTFKFENLPKGRYRLYETEAPKGYTKIDRFLEEFIVINTGIIKLKVGKVDDLNTPVDEVDIKNYQEVGSDPIEVINYKDIEFVKVDAGSGATIKGADFELWYKPSDEPDESGNKPEYEKIDMTNPEYANLIKHIKEDGVNIGSFKVHVTKPGYYALKETKVPEGYKKPTEEFVREFLVKDGRVQILEKDPFRASTRISGRGLLETQILEADQGKKTFKQRIVINPDQKPWTFDSLNTYLTLNKDDWKLANSDNKIRVAVLDKGRSYDSLKPNEFNEYSPKQNQTDDELYYQIKDMFKSGDYTTDSTDTNKYTTEKSLVVEFVGESTGSGEKEGKSNLHYQVVDGIAINGQISYNFDFKNFGKDFKPVYVDKSRHRPVRIENTKIHKIKFKKVDAKRNKEGEKDPLGGAEFRLVYRDKEIEEKVEGGKKVQTEVEWTPLSLYKKTTQKADGSTETEYDWIPTDSTNVPTEYERVQDTFKSSDQGENKGMVEFDNITKEGYYGIQEVKAPKDYAITLNKDKLVKKFVIKEGKVWLMVDDKANNKVNTYYQKEDGYYYEDKEVTDNLIKLKSEKDGDKIVYTWTINPTNNALAYKDAKLEIRGKKLPEDSSVKVSVHKKDGTQSDHTATLANGILSLDQFFDSGKLATPSQEDKKETKSTNKLVISWTSDTLVTEEKPDYYANVRSKLSGLDGKFIDLSDSFKVSKSHDDGIIQSSNKKAEFRYVDNGLVQTDQTGNLEVENRKIELPKALGTDKALIFTIAGLAVMILAAYVYHKKKVVA